MSHGCRALAYLNGGTCRIVSRDGNTFTRFDPLAAGLAQAQPTTTAILDGEIVCLDVSVRRDQGGILAKVPAAQTRGRSGVIGGGRGVTLLSFKTFHADAGVRWAPAPGARA